MSLPLYQVDAFTSTPFLGNPAAVCLLDGPADAAWMQNVAREMNLSETAFVHATGESFSLRWFTPAVEVDLCGHATLATAHVLWETGLLAPDATALFDTLSGRLTALKHGHLIEMDFPAVEAQTEPAPDGLIDALGVEALHVARNRLDYLVEVASGEIVRSLAPDLAAIARLPVRGVIVTSRADTVDYDFVSRFFAPGSGVPEDPVTGSAHACLGPYWGARLGKSELVGYQASARGGIVYVRVDGERVVLAGEAVTVMRGEFVTSNR